MPELPEVEVLRRSLDAAVRGRTIERVDVHDRRLRDPIAPDFEERLRGRTVESLGRRAKYLLFGLSGGASLLVHLGMSGRLLWSRGRGEPAPHQHWRLRFGDGSSLTYRDPRRFGLAEVVAGAPAQHPRLRHLGVEPLGDAFDADYLRRQAAGRRRRVKDFLMDQEVVVGVGNIYASEALFHARVHPSRRVSRVALTTWSRIVDSTRRTLAGAIEAGGSTLNDFRDGVGDPGYFQIQHAVYDREGEPCARCCRDIRRIVLAGRSTFYCPSCQH